VKVNNSGYQPKLRQINNFLSVIVIMLALYIFVWPLLPQFMWWVKHDAPVVSYSASNTIPSEPVPAENTLLIPKLDLRQPINEGNSLAAANHGTWRRPQTATPSETNNTVIVGHRFTYKGASVFYHLDKLTIGDKIVVYWEGQAYHYEVIATKIVPPSDGSVEASTNQKLLTLYTCTPLWTAENRLVIIAKPTEGANQ
jgi:sortase A